MGNPIAISIPGAWNSQKDLLSTLAKRFKTEYIFVGSIFLDSSTNASCEFNVGTYTPDLVEDFQLASQWKLSAGTLDTIRQHHHAVHLTFPQSGADSCRKAARFAKVFLQAGGFAVKVDSANLAHSKEKWLEHCDSTDLYSLFVRLMEGRKGFYSCGMQNFGLPDVAFNELGDVQEAVRILHAFNRYQLEQSPQLEDGSTFRPDTNSPLFSLKWSESLHPKDDPLLHNSFGIWQLLRM